MPFRLFHDFFPELAEQETRSVLVLPDSGPGIPPGEYGLLEMFCDEPGCDCRRVFFSVFSRAAGQAVAVVAWGWEDIGFYMQWMRQGSREDAKELKGPILNMGSPAAAYAPALLELVSEILDRDSAYVERIKRHYAMFRARVEGGNTPQPGLKDNIPARAYGKPVSKLLDMDEPEQKPADYAAFGIGQEHVPGLIRMATDRSLHHAPMDSSEVWAPVHAWRALSQLRAVEAVEPLVSLLALADEDQDDWVAEDLPEALSAFGAAAILPLTAFLEDTSRGPRARAAASLSLGKIGQCHPQERDRCVAVLTGQLEHFAENGQELNGFLVLNLLDLDAAESAPVMEEAFAADAIDLSMAGDWEDVQIELGLLDKRITPRQWGWTKPRAAVPKVKPPQGSGKSKTGKKKKRKTQKKSRKKNRKK
jgi:hypothetical protein